MLQGFALISALLLLQTPLDILVIQILLQLESVTWFAKPPAFIETQPITELVSPLALIIQPIKPIKTQQR
jgi:hypothetical protein